MVPLIVQLVVFAAVLLVGASGWLTPAPDLRDALRYSLAAMFVFTAIAHFTPRTRGEMVRMVPPAFPRPGAMVTLTGLLQFAGAMGLVIPTMAPLAGSALAALLVALFPANVHAARAGLEIGGRKAMPLMPRLALQLFWIGCLLYTAAPDFGLGLLGRS